MKRIQAAKEIQDTTSEPQRDRAHKNLQCFENLATVLKRRDDGPTAAEIHDFVEKLGNVDSERMQKFIVLVKSLNKLAEGPERQAARRLARKQLNNLHENYRLACVQLAQQLDEMQSPERLAALLAPQDERALLMQRMEDSNLRQLWRLTNVMFKVRNGALTRRDVKNEGRTDYVYENTVADDKLSGEITSFLPKSAPLEG
jgi:hypothetical protein